MRTMKDSGIHWIGKIPEDWALEKLKFCAGLRVEKIAADSSEDLQYVGLEHVEPQSGRLVSDYEPIFDFSGDTVRYHKDDVLFGKLRPYLAKAYKADEVGKCSSEFFVMSPASVSSDFLAFLVLSKGFVDAVNGSTFGVKMPRAEWEFVGNMKIPLPSLHRQKIIASFLANRCGQIDSVIAAKEKTNEALKAYRQSVIYEAVTKGLDPAAPLKDSGIPWIGEIPVAWMTRKLKHLVQTKITDGPHSTPTLLDEGIPFVSAESIKDNKVNLSFKRGYISKEDHNMFCQKCRPQKGDIFMVKSGATTGAIAIVDFDEEFSIWSPLALIRCREDTFSQKFIFYAMQSDSFRKQVEVYWSFGTQQNIGMGVIENLFVATPEKPEQEDVVAYLDDKCGQIDAVLAANEAIVKKLREYRQSLIYEAVTGKIACD